MIVYKQWRKVSNGGLVKTYWEGWFLFGFIPLYIRQRKDRGIDRIR
jgi:hypothetical protein